MGNSNTCCTSREQNGEGSFSKKEKKIFKALFQNLSRDG